MWPKLEIKLKQLFKCVFFLLSLLLLELKWERTWQNTELDIKYCFLCWVWPCYNPNCLWLSRVWRITGQGFLICSLNRFTREWSIPSGVTVNWSFVKFRVFLARLCFLVRSWAKKFLFFSISRKTFLAWLDFAVWAVFQVLACRSLASMALTQTGVLTLGCMWPAEMVTNPLNRKLLCLLLESFFNSPSPFLRLMNFSPCWLAHWFLNPTGGVPCRLYLVRCTVTWRAFPREHHPLEKAPEHQPP